MTRQLIVLTTALVLVCVSGCATKVPEPTPLRSDWRTGTDFSPYRTIPTAIQCDDCRYER